MESRKVLMELYAGIFLCTIAGLILGVVLGIIFGGWAWLFIPGLLAGAFTACYQAYHIYKSLDVALGSEDGQKANNYMTLQSLLRYAISAIVLIVAVLICWQAFVGAAVGLAFLKLSGYLNPLVRKLMGHKDEVKDFNMLLMENSEKSLARDKASNKDSSDASENDKDNESDTSSGDEDDDDEFDYTFKPIGMKNYKN